MIDVVFTPGDLVRVAEELPGSQLVVLDVIRATSTMVTGLHFGAKEIFLFDSLDAVRKARGGFKEGPVVMAGEEKCLKVGDFDVGNSPREFVTERVGGATVLMSTTNGTRAAVKGRVAKKMFAGSLLNAAATAEALLAEMDSLHTIFLCAGTDGKLALEDAIGAGAILFALLQTTYRADLPFTDGAWLAYHTFAGVRQRLAAGLRLGAGGVNVIEAGLEEDIDWCARLDAFPIVARIDGATLRVTKE